MKNIRKIIFLFLLIGILNIKNVSAETTLNCNKTLRYGSKGEQVKLLQKELNKVQNCNLTIDGSFGPATKSCVLAFQKKNSLSQDAIVGPKTCKKLNELYLDNNEEVEETPSTLSLTTTSTLKRGSNNSQVKILQEMLNKLSSLQSGEISIVNGLYRIEDFSEYFELLSISAIFSCTYSLVGRLAISSCVT